MERVKILPSDIICGKGRAFTTRTANVKYKELIAEYASKHRSRGMSIASVRQEILSVLNARIIVDVDRQNGTGVIMTPSAMDRKVGQALRNARKKQQPSPPASVKVALKKTHSPLFHGAVSSPASREMCQDKPRGHFFGGVLGDACGGLSANGLPHSMSLTGIPSQWSHRATNISIRSDDLLSPQVGCGTATAVDVGPNTKAMLDTAEQQWVGERMDESKQSFFGLANAEEQRIRGDNEEVGVDITLGEEDLWDNLRL